jgi:hypothetical protein
MGVKGIEKSDVLRRRFALPNSIPIAYLADFAF